MSINGFKLAGRYVRAACSQYKIMPISRLEFDEIYNTANFLLTNKSQIISLKNIFAKLESQLPESLYQASKLAILHNNENLIGDIFKYWCLFYQQNCEQLVDIQSSKQLNKRQQDQCVKFLQNYNKLDVNSRFSVNKDLIAGIRIETPYLLFDDTIKNKINFMTRLLKNYAGNI
jgi:F0F1-type ATP synthase delta subunit